MFCNSYFYQTKDAGEWRCDVQIYKERNKNKEISDKSTLVSGVLTVDVTTTTTTTTTVTTSSETSMSTEVPMHSTSKNETDEDNRLRHIGFRTKYARDLGNAAF